MAQNSKYESDKRQELLQMGDCHSYIVDSRAKRVVMEVRVLDPNAPGQPSEKVPVNRPIPLSSEPSLTNGHSTKNDRKSQSSQTRKTPIKVDVTSGNREKSLQRTERARPNDSCRCLSNKKDRLAQLMISHHMQLQQHISENFYHGSTEKSMKESALAFGVKDLRDSNSDVNDAESNSSDEDSDTDEQDEEDIHDYENDSQLKDCSNPIAHTGMFVISNDGHGQFGSCVGRGDRTRRSEPVNRSVVEAAATERKVASDTGYIKFGSACDRDLIDMESEANIIDREDEIDAGHTRHNPDNNHSQCEKSKAAIENGRLELISNGNAISSNKSNEFNELNESNESNESNVSQPGICVVCEDRMTTDFANGNDTIAKKFVTNKSEIIEKIDKEKVLIANGRLERSDVHTNSKDRAIELVPAGGVPVHRAQESGITFGAIRGMGLVENTPALSVDIIDVLRSDIEDGKMISNGGLTGVRPGVLQKQPINSGDSDLMQREKHETPIAFEKHGDAINAKENDPPPGICAVNREVISKTSYGDSIAPKLGVSETIFAFAGDNISPKSATECKVNGIEIKSNSGTGACDGKEVTSDTDKHDVRSSQPTKGDKFHQESVTSERDQYKGSVNEEHGNAITSKENDPTTGIYVVRVEDVLKTANDYGIAPKLESTDKILAPAGDNIYSKSATECEAVESDTDKHDIRSSQLTRGTGDKGSGSVKLDRDEVDVILKSDEFKKESRTFERGQSRGSANDEDGATEGVIKGEVHSASDTEVGKLGNQSNNTKDRNQLESCKAPIELFTSNANKNPPDQSADSCLSNVSTQNECGHDEGCNLDGNIDDPVYSIKDANGTQTKEFVNGTLKNSNVTLDTESIIGVRGSGTADPETQEASIEDVFEFVCKYKDSVAFLSFPELEDIYKVIGYDKFENARFNTLMLDIVRQSVAADDGEVHLNESLIIGRGSSLFGADDYDYLIKYLIPYMRELALDEFEYRHLEGLLLCDTTVSPKFGEVARLIWGLLQRHGEATPDGNVSLRIASLLPVFTRLAGRFEMRLTDRRHSAEQTLAEPTEYPGITVDTGPPDTAEGLVMESGTDHAIRASGGFKLNCVAINCKSLVSLCNMPEVTEDLLRTQSVDVAFIAETWWRQVHSPYFERYTVLRHDTGQYAAPTGTGIIIKNHFNCTAVRLNHVVHIDYTAAEIDTGRKSKILVMSLHIDPGIRAVDLNSDLNSISSHLHNKTYEYFIIGGDFNARHISWSARANTIGQNLLRWVHNNRRCIKRVTALEPTFPRSCSRPQNFLVPVDLKYSVTTAIKFWGN